MGCGGSASRTKETEKQNQTTTQNLNPVANEAVFGANGLFAGASNLLQNNPLKAYEGPTYAGLNSTQTDALNSGINYLGSDAAMGGYRALQKAGNSLINTPFGQLNLPGISAQNVSASPISASGIDPSLYGSKITAPKVDAVGVGGSGFNYGDAVNRILSGQVENPQLTQMMRDTAGVSTENFLRNVAPSLRGGAIAAGGYGGSRSGIAEGLATSDLNNQIQRSNTNLLGNLYESAQNRMGNLASQLSGQDAQARIASAQMAQQARLANAGFDLQGQLANLQNAMQGAQFNATLGQQAALANQDAGLRAALANQGAGLQAAGMNQSGQLAQFGLNQDAQQQALANRLQGANVLQGASQIPLANFGAMFNLGQTQQQDQQGQYTDAYNRFMQNQMAPWQTLDMYSNLIGPYSQLGGTQYQEGRRDGTSTNVKGGFTWGKVG